MDKEIILKIIEQIEAKLELMKAVAEIESKIKPLPIKEKIEIPKLSKEDNKIEELTEIPKKCLKCNKKYKKQKVKLINDNYIQEFKCKKCGDIKILKQPI